MCLRCFGQKPNHLGQSCAAVGAHSPRRRSSSSDSAGRCGRSKTIGNPAWNRWTGAWDRWQISLSRGRIVSFQITILKVLAGHPDGRASISELTRYVSILMTSGSDFTDRMRQLAARAPKLEIFGDRFVLRDGRGWCITESGRQFVASLEAPIPARAEHQASEAAAELTRFSRPFA